jgi:hypothetical protein
VSRGEPSMWPSTSGTTYSARLLADILPMPEAPFRRGFADGYVCRAAALLAPRVVVDRVGAHYRAHGSNTDPFLARPRLDLQGAQRELARWAEMYAYLDQFAQSRAPGCLAAIHQLQAHDVAYLTLRMACRGLDAAPRARAGDDRCWLAWRGIRAVSRSPHVSATGKCLRCAWFGAMAVAPRVLARRLAERQLCPDSRLRFGRRRKTGEERYG